MQEVMKAVRGVRSLRDGQGAVPHRYRVMLNTTEPELAQLLW